MVNAARLRSPKIRSAERKRSPFPYYAGYSVDFVRDVLNHVGASSEHTILDPWNGSGTTTAVASALGIPSFGIDLNPAMHVIAKARTASSRDLRRAHSFLPKRDRKFSQSLLQEICAPNQNSRAGALLLLALFRQLRRRLKHENHRSSNPTWWTNEIRHIHEILPSISIASTRQELDSVEASLATEAPPRNQNFVSPKLIVGNLLTLSLPPSHFDFVLSSPPYLTRIDYVKATLPELSLLSLIQKIDLTTLRSQMVGSPVVGSGPTSLPLDIGQYGREILRSVLKHHSKASSTYYTNFFSAYIQKMYLAISMISRYCKPHSRVALVVQGSHYKEIHIDLARLLCEAGVEFGFCLEERVEFPFRNSFAQFNPKAKGYRDETATESLILLRRGDP